MRCNALMWVCAIAFTGAGASSARAGIWDKVKEGYEKVEEGVKKGVEKVEEGVKKGVEKTEEGVKKGVTEAEKLAEQVKNALKDTTKKLAELGKVGLGVLKELAREAWKHLLSLSCDGFMNTLFQKGPLNSNASVAQIATACGQEFAKGFVCSIPNLILDTAKLIEESAEYAWRAKVICVPAGLVAGGLTPAAAGPILACGAGYMVADKLPKAMRCAKKLLEGGGGGEPIWPVLVEFGCNFAGSLLVDVIIAILSGGAAGPPVIAKKIGQIAETLTAKLPAAVRRSAEKLGKAKAAATRLKLATKLLDTAAECKF